MIYAGGVYLPDGEIHLVDLMAGPKEIEIDGIRTYQWRKQQAVYAACKSFRTAIDIGGHCGLWSMHMASRFAAVHAFEPVERHRECFRKNVTAANVTLHECALGGVASDKVFLHSGPNSSGDTTIQPFSGEHEAEMRTLDSFELQNVDFVKIDCEGFEAFILHGAEQTIKAWKPMMIVEQKPGKGTQFGLNDTEAVTLLESWGAKVVKVMSGDYIMTF